MKKWSKVSKKTFNTVLIIELFVVAIMFIIFYESYSNDFGENTIIRDIILLVMGIILPILISPFLKMYFQQKEDFDISKKYVRQHLSEEYRVEVIPIKDERQHEYFLTKELCKRAKFYAQIMSDGTILISLKFNGENEYVYYGGISSEVFKTYFKVLDS